MNLGHTVGHAIEKCSGFCTPHGHAVAAGLAVMTRAAERLGWTQEPIAGRIAACLAKNDLPTGTDFSAADLARAALSDKKRSGDTITIVVPRRIGTCQLHKLPGSGAGTPHRRGTGGIRWIFASHRKSSPVA